MKPISLLLYPLIRYLFHRPLDLWGLYNFMILKVHVALGLSCKHVGSEACISHFLMVRVRNADTESSTTSYNDSLFAYQH